MKRNEHIGLTSLKWKVYSIPLAFLFYWLIGYCLRYIVELLPDPIVDSTIPGTGIYQSDVLQIIELHQDNGLFSIFLISIGLELITSIQRLLVGFRIIGEKAASIIISDQGIIGTILYLCGAYFAFYEMAYVNMKEITAYHTMAEHKFMFLVWGIGFAQFYIQVGLADIFADKLSGVFKVWMRITQDKNYHKMYNEGFGGSARWANEVELSKRGVEFKNTGFGLDTTEIILGRSLFHDDSSPRLISVKDDVHMVTMGMTGSGKSTTVLMPNLAYYSGSIYAFDPKGELAKNTLRRRTAKEKIDSEWTKVRISKGKTKEHFEYGMGYALDPFNETGGEFGNSRYNPLSDINLEDDNAAAMLNAISDGCVLPQHEKDSHWSDWAKNLIEALIVHVLTRYPKENHNLPFVLDLFSGKTKPNYDVKESELDNFTELMIDMMTNEDAFGGIVQQVSSKIMDMGENERGAVLSTTYRSLKWIGDPKMRMQLTDTNIFFEGQPHTVYIILPQENISGQIRWVRVLMGMFIGREKRLNKVHPHRPASLFIFDEFYQLGGNLDAISKGFPMLRGFNIKLWLIVQDIAQLKQVFGKTWADIVSGSTVQAFGINDTETAEWISKRLGSRQNIEETEGNKEQGTSGRTYKRIEPLLSPDEVETMLSKNNDEQIVFPTDGRPMRLQRLSYKPIRGYNVMPMHNLSKCFEDYDD